VIGGWQDCVGRGDIERDVEPKGELEHAGESECKGESERKGEPKGELERKGECEHEGERKGTGDLGSEDGGERGSVRITQLLTPIALVAVVLVNTFPAPVVFQEPEGL
jgi:hypothetical protein